MLNKWNNNYKRSKVKKMSKFWNSWTKKSKKKTKFF